MRQRYLTQLIALGTDTLMPVLVYGFESTDIGTDEVRLPLDFEPPDWLCAVLVQAGGYGMSYYSVVGAVFRLADNARHALSELGPLLRAFHLMAEDPDIRAIKKEYPKLEPIVGTWGAPYDSDQLGRVGRFVGRYFSLPAPQSGLEAFVRLGSEHPGRMSGWSHLHVKGAPRELEGSRVIDEVRVEGAFGQEERDVLEEVRRQAFPHLRKPELFLVWENSD